MSDTVTDDQPTRTPPPAPGPARPPLRRRTDDRMIAGVASGLARTLGVEPAVIRVVLVLAVFFGGLGVPLYIAGWLLIPEEGSDEAVATELVRSRGAQFWIGIVLLVIGVLALADQASDLTGGLAWPLVLIGIGVVLWRSSQREGEQVADGPHARPVADRAAPAGSAADHVEAAVSAPSEPPAPPAPPVAAPATSGSTPPGPPPTARQRSMLGRVTAAVVLIVSGSLWLVDQLGLVAIGGGEILAVALGLIGVGLIVGSWFGRARWLILPGLLLIPIVTVAASLDGTGIDLADGMGERAYTPATTGEVAEGYELTAGELRLDLTELEVGDQPIPVDAQVAFGSLQVIVPDGVAVEVDANVGVGEIRVFGEGPEGAGLDHSFGRSGDGGPIVLELDVSVGEIVVESAPAP